MPRLGRGAVPDGVTMLPVTPTATRRVFALWRADATERPAVRAAVQALRHAAAMTSSR